MGFGFLIIFSGFCFFLRFCFIFVVRTVICGFYEWKVISLWFWFCFRFDHGIWYGLGKNYLLGFDFCLSFVSFLYFEGFFMIWSECMHRWFFLWVWFLYSLFMCVITVLMHDNLVYNKKKFTFKSPLLNLQNGIDFCSFFEAYFLSFFAFFVWGYFILSYSMVLLFD